EAILASDADIVYLLEAAPMTPELGTLAEKYPYRIGCGEVTSGCDLMMLSRLPMKTRAIYRLSEIRGERFAVAEVEIGGRIVHFAAAHLTKPYFDDYHSAELLMIGGHIARNPGTWVLGGDFNS